MLYISVLTVAPWFHSLLFFPRGVLSFRWAQEVGSHATRYWHAVLPLTVEIKRDKPQDLDFTRCDSVPRAVNLMTPELRLWAEGPKLLWW